MTKPHKHHLALAITIIIVWNTSAAGQATPGLVVNSCKLCLARLHLLRIFHFVQMLLQQSIGLTAWAIRQVAIAEITGRVTRNVLHAHMQTIGAIGVRHSRDTNRDYLGTRKIHFKIFKNSWKIKNTQNTIRLKATVRGTAPDFSFNYILVR